MKIFLFLSCLVIFCFSFSLEECQVSQCKYGQPRWWPNCDIDACVDDFYSKHVFRLVEGYINTTIQMMFTQNQIIVRLLQKTDERPANTPGMMELRNALSSLESIADKKTKYLALIRNVSPFKGIYDSTCRSAFNFYVTANETYKVIMRVFPRFYQIVENDLNNVNVSEDVLKRDAKLAKELGVSLNENAIDAKESVDWLEKAVNSADASTMTMYGVSRFFVSRAMDHFHYGYADLTKELLVVEKQLNKIQPDGPGITQNDEDFVYGEPPIWPPLYDGNSYEESFYGAGDMPEMYPWMA